MSTSIRLGAITTALGLTGALLLAAPAQASVATITGDIKGTIKTVGTSYASVAVTATPSSLRLIKGRTVKFVTDSKTYIRLDGRSARLRDLVAGDVVSARVRCTFTITSSATRISCRAIRLTAVSPTPVTPIPTGPVTFVVTGRVAGLQSAAIAITPTNIEADAAATPVVTALRAALPMWFSVDSATVVMLGGSVSRLGVIGNGDTATLNVTCQPKQPYNCRATRLELALSAKQPVKLVGLVTLVTTTSLTLNVETVVHTETASTDVHMLRLSQLSITVPANANVTFGGKAATVSSLPLGVRVTVLAQCRLEVPFDCTAQSITG